MIYPDASLTKVADLFQTDPVWVKSMGAISVGVESTVYFSHRPDEIWHLVKEKEGVVLRPGRATNPDFIFRFTPQAIAQLAATKGGADVVGVALFDLILTDDPALAVGFRIVASFWTLVRHGHLQLVVTSGPRVLAYGARHGIVTAGQLRAFVGKLRTTEPASWER